MSTYGASTTAKQHERENTMELNDYQQQALSTALPSALTTQYLLPGLVAEVGEVCGVFAKAERDDWTGPHFDAALFKELGDVAWFVVVLAHVTDVPLPHDAEPAFSSDGPVPLLVHAALQVLCCDPEDTISIVWEALLGLAKTFQIPMDEVLQANLAKLADRKRRGAIMGSGDHR